MPVMHIVRNVVSLYFIYRSVLKVSIILLEIYLLSFFGTMRRSWTCNQIVFKSLKYFSHISFYDQRFEIILFGYLLNDAINVLFALEKFLPGLNIFANFFSL